METRHASELSSALGRPGTPHAAPNAAPNTDHEQTVRDRATPRAVPRAVPLARTDAGKPGDDGRASPRAAVVPVIEPARRATPQLATRMERPTLADAAQRVAAKVRASIGDERFEGSFANKAVFRVENGVLEVATPNKILSGMLERRFGELLRQVVAGEIGECAVRFVVAGDLFGPHTFPGVHPEPEAGEAPATKPGSAPRKAAPRASANERYRIESFIVGDSNRLAYNAGQQLAEGEKDSGAFGPLFIHGPCGVGKTHLLNAVAQRFKENHPGAVVRVTGGEAFMNEYVAGVRAGDVEKFRRAFRRVDLLCIDDVHFLSHKQSTQGELLHTLDELERAGARIVLVSDEHPRQIRQFSAALVSRFMAGMVAGIQAPDASLREKCVRMFAKQRGLTLEPAAVETLVQRTGQLPGQEPATIRDIEGLITRVDALHRLVPDYADQAKGAGQNVGVLLVERAHGHAGGSTVVDPGAPIRAARPVRIDAVISHTCAALAVDTTDLAGKTRHPRVVLARALITHLARQLTTLSYPEIARAIGRPNHSTVITAFQRFAKQLVVDGPVEAPGAPEARTLTVLVRQVAAAAQTGRR